MHETEYSIENALIVEAKDGAYSDEHAHARVWNHMTSLGIGHDKEKMMAELQKAKKDKKHPLHFDNAQDHEGFVGGKKTAAHRASFYAEHENAIHTIHGLATHPDFAEAVKGKHRAAVTGGGTGELSDLWKQYGATKGATSKTDIAIMKPNSKSGEGIRISLKKGEGSQLMSAGPEETNAVHHAAADEMLANHPKYKKLSKNKKAEIHANIMRRIKAAGKHLDAMRTAKESELQGLKVKAQKSLNSVFDEHPELTHFVRKEATTGRAKFVKGSPNAASYIVKSAAGKVGVSVKDVDDMDFDGPRPRAALPKGSTSKGRRSGNVKLDERKEKTVKTLKEEIKTFILERKRTKEERMAMASEKAMRNRQMQQARLAADVASKNELEGRRAVGRNIAAAAKQRQGKEGEAQTYWRDDEGYFRVGGAQYAAAAAKGANLSKHQIVKPSAGFSATDVKLLQGVKQAVEKQVQEEAPANAMGTAGISGLDTAVNVGIAGRDTLLAPGVLRRPPPKMFGGKRVFTVPSSEYYKATLGRRKGQHWRSMVNGPLGEEIRQYALENKDAPIIVEDEMTGAMMYLRYGKR